MCDKPGIPGPWPLIGAKHGKRTDITITIEEGEQYRMGRLRFRSSDPEQGLVFKTEALRRVFPLKEGEFSRRTNCAKRSTTTKSCTANTDTSTLWPRR